MTNEGAATCARQFSFATLSSWRDGQLSAKLAAEISDHTPHCAACQNALAEMGMIAQMLRRHDPPTLLTPATQAQLWRSLQPTAIQRQGATHMPINQRARWRNISGAIAAVLIIVLFVQVLRLHTASGAKNQVGASPSPLASVNTIPLAPLGLTLFSPTDLAPDGSFIIGVAARSQQAQFVEYGTIDTHTKQYHKLVDVSQGDGAATTPITDGRYIAYQTFNDANPQDPWLNVTVLDTVTHHQTTLAKEGATSANLFEIDHGTLYWQRDTLVTLSDQPYKGIVQGSGYESPGPLLATDLATGTSRTLLPAMDAVSNLILPIAVYQQVSVQGGKVTDGPVHALNLSTGQDESEPSVQVHALITTNNGMLYTSSLDFASGGYKNMTVYAKDPAEATWHTIATNILTHDGNLWITNTEFLGTTNSGSPRIVANARLIVWDEPAFKADGKEHLLALDRAKKTQVDLGQILPFNQELIPINFFARGEWFVYQTFVNSTNVLNVIDTSQRP